MRLEEFTAYMDLMESISSREEAKIKTLL